MARLEPVPERSPAPAGGPPATIDAPGPLVDATWLATHLGDPDLRLVHVSTSRRTYNRRHIPGAVFADLHRELATRGTAPETGDAEREWLVPERPVLEAALARWGVGEGDRVVFYDDIGQNRWAVRGLWLLRLHRFPRALVHVLDGGLDLWLRNDGATTAEPPPPVSRERPPVHLGEPDADLVATYDDVLSLSARAAEDPPGSILDVRTPGEFVGSDVRARRGGHVPGARQRVFTDFLAEDGTFRSPEEIVAILRSGGVEPADVRTTYCQGCVRASLAWFALSELAGYEQVKPYAGSWEEWGNRPEAPVETTE